MAKIIYHTASSPAKEVAGLLVGTFGSDILRINDTVTGNQSGTRASVVLSDEVQAIVAEKLEKEGEGQYIVGWYHSHPSLGVFMSGTDISTQTIFQNLDPNTVALVIDPAGYIRSRRPLDSEFKIFQVKQNHKYEEVPTTVASTPSKKLEKLLRPLTLEHNKKVAVLAQQIENSVYGARKQSSNPLSKWIIGK